MLYGDGHSSEHTIVELMEKMKQRGYQTSLSTLLVPDNDNTHRWTYSVWVQDAREQDNQEQTVRANTYATDPMIALCTAIIVTFRQDVEDADNEARADAMKL